MKYRKNNGRYASTKFFTILTACIALGYALVYGYEGFISFVTPIEYKASQTAISMVSVARAERTPDRLDKAVDKLKDEVVDKLLGLEGKGLVIRDGSMKPTFDPPQSLKAQCSRIGGVMNEECLSYGKAQMKLGTIRLWRKELGLPEMSDMEEIKMAFDEKETRAFVKEVIFTIPGSIWQWSAGTNNREWFDTHISLIRELENIK
jgi:hypothetical protein